VCVLVPASISRESSSLNQADMPGGGSSKSICSSLRTRLSATPVSAAMIAMEARVFHRHSKVTLPSEGCVAAGAGHIHTPLPIMIPPARSFLARSPSSTHSCGRPGDDAAVAASGDDCAAIVQLMDASKLREQQDALETFRLPLSLSHAHHNVPSGSSAAQRCCSRSQAA
jgi:hypothetical protein